MIQILQSGYEKSNFLNKKHSIAEHCGYNAVNAACNGMMPSFVGHSKIC